MAITRATPNLMVEDVNRTVTFYLEALGFAFVLGVPEGGKETLFNWPTAGPLAFAMVQSGQACLMFQTRASLAAELPRLAEAKIGGSVVLYMDCDDLDALYARVSEITPFIKAPHTTFYGARECSIADCNGYVLTFAQRADATPKPSETPL
jgi:uncharacterized glyoxalase superfamily protein PhnB